MGVVLMRESEMWPVVSGWFKARGFRVYGEVPDVGSAVDLVAYDGQRLEAGELKTSLSRKVLYQACLNQNWADASWCIVPTAPKNLALPIRWGLGVLQWSRERAVVLVAPNAAAQHARSPHIEHSRRIIELLGMCYQRPGGLANLAGEGPAQDCARRVVAWLATNPARRWIEVFRGVPNHYVNAKSLASVMSRRFGIVLNEGAFARKENPNG